MSERTIYKICTAAEWRAAERIRYRGELRDRAKRSIGEVHKTPATEEH